LKPFPTPLQAALLTLMGSFFAGAVALVAMQWTTPTAALGIGGVVGLGAAGALGAANVPPPHGARVGLRGLQARHLLPLLLLLPVAFLASEVDNVMKIFLPPPDAPQVAQDVIEKLPTDTRLALVETLVVAVGLVPILEEWFFRGIVQQGLVASVGVRGGVFLTALLFAMGHGAPGVSPQSWAALVTQALVLGLVFGVARHATGSILASIFLHIGVNGLGVAALAAPGVLSIPGYNAPGDHTPLAVIVPSLLAVAAGLALLARETPPEIPDAPALPEGDGGGDG
jgi:membrane protease YdiL (CAAX protease family)